MPIVLCTCVSLSVTVKDVYVLKMFVTRMLRRNLYLTGNDKKLENASEKLRNLYSSPYFSETIELYGRDKGD